MCRLGSLPLGATAFHNELDVHIVRRECAFIMINHLVPPRRSAAMNVNFGQCAVAKKNDSYWAAAVSEPTATTSVSCALCRNCDAVVEIIVESDGGSKL